MRHETTASILVFKAFYSLRVIPNTVQFSSRLLSFVISIPETNGRALLRVTLILKLCVQILIWY